MKLKLERIANSCVCCNSRNINASPAVLMPFISHRVFNWIPTKIRANWNLQTLKKGTCYSICNSLLCKSCGLIFLDIRFTDDELNKLYNNYRGKEYSQLREKYEKGYLKRNYLLNVEISYKNLVEKFLEPLINFPINILDWGGADGKNSPFNEVRKKLDVFDISNKQVIKSAKSVTKLQALKNSYNLIVCSNVLEHIPYPSDLLVEIKKFMKKRTILYIEVPYENIMKKYKKNNALYKKRHWHEHINFFSEKSLRKLIKLNKFELIKLKAISTKIAQKKVNLFQIACRLN
jgi:hypothetical protein